ITVVLYIYLIIFVFFFSSRRRHTRFSRDWSSDVCSSDLWSTSTEKDYTNLPAGNYEFHVKAMNNFNAESEVVTFYFKIMPPWYKSTAAYLGYALLLAFATFGLDSFQRKK